MNFAKRVDADHALFVRTLRRMGWCVKDTHALPEFVDAVICRAGVLKLVEFKSARGSLTPAQKELCRDFGVVILRSIEDCIRLR